MSNMSETIAIIDDDAAVRTSLMRLLSSMGYHTELYDSAEAFIASAGRSQAGCLIIDEDLGIMSGLDLVQHSSVVALRRPIILHSASNNPELRYQAFAAGCAAFLCKPYEFTELLEALVRAAERCPGSFK
jgi:two-component system, LuxR family, response regulator FixJ